MLTRLFSNISLQAGISSVLVMVCATIAVVYVVEIPEYHYQLEGFSLVLSPFWIKTGLLFIVPLSSLFFANTINSLGILPGAFHITILFGLQLLLFSIEFLHIEMLFSLPFFVFAFKKLFKIGLVVDARTALFDLGLLAGFISFFFVEGVIIVPFCWAACVIFRCISIKTVLVPVLGVLALYSILFTISFFFTDFDFVSHIIGQWQSISLNVMQYDYLVLLQLSPIIVLSLIAIVDVVRKIVKATVFKRQVISLTIVLLVVIVLLSLIQNKSVSIYFLAAFPISIVQYQLIISCPRWWQKDLIYLVVLASFALILF